MAGFNTTYLSWRSNVKDTNSNLHVYRRKSKNSFSVMKFCCRSQRRGQLSKVMNFVILSPTCIKVVIEPNLKLLVASSVQKKN